MDGGGSRQLAGGDYAKSPSRVVQLRLGLLAATSQPSTDDEEGDTNRLAEERGGGAAAADLKTVLRAAPEPIKHAQAQARSARTPVDSLVCELVLVCDVRVSFTRSHKLMQKPNDNNSGATSERNLSVVVVVVAWQ